MKKFYWMWFGQLFSTLASGITNFALGIWILKQSASVMDYATLMVVATLPGILLTPFIGALIDRHNRKTIIILADVVAAITTLIVALLYFNDSLALWHIYLVVAIDSIALAFQIPAVTAAISMIVPKESLGKAAGFNELSMALAMIGGPFFAGMLILVIDLSGILVIDLLTFLFAAGVMLFVKIPDPPQKVETQKASTLIEEAREGWSFIIERQGFKQLLIFSAMINFIGGMVIVLIMPMALQITDEAKTGLIMSAGGVGSLLGGAYMAISGGPKRKIHGIIGGTLMAGFFLFFVGAFPVVWTIALALMLFYACLPILSGSEQVLWQRKVDPALQGRVLASYLAVSSITMPVGSYMAGILAQAVQSSGIATAPGRGIGMMIMAMGVAVVLISLWAWTRRAIRDIEDNLPDRVDVAAHQNAC